MADSRHHSGETVEVKIRTIAMTDQPKESKHSNSAEDYSFSGEISTATLIRLLISKGIFTSEEIIAAEKKQRTRRRRPTHSDSYHRSQQKPVKSSLLKRFISRYRWLRKLTSALFGWQWKRVKVKSSDHNSPTISQN
jgi:hypothetical protein